MRVELDVNIPEGYEATGEWRCPKAGEFYLTNQALVTRTLCDYETSYLILRKKTRKVIVFIPVDSFEEATCDPFYSGARYYQSPKGYIHIQEASRFSPGETWLRREEREESI
jgi:hypothetical protein